MPDLTFLERGALDAICRAGDPEIDAENLSLLVKLLSNARISARDNTGHGFYTKLEIDRTLTPPLRIPTMIPGPHAWMVGLGEDATISFILWITDGYPATLEGFQNGDIEGNTVDLTTFDLGDLVFSRFSSD
jgi:hypothetical protein